jgi:hypothetical protein
MNLKDIRNETKRKMELAPQEPIIRTDFRCRAEGCPNAGSMFDLGEDTDRRGRCFFHFKETDSRSWPTVTRWIQDNWSKARNW